MLGKNVAFLSVGLLLLSCVAHAQDVTEGHLLAGRWCSVCVVKTIGTVEGVV
jgi:hypothetical protein